MDVDLLIRGGQVIDGTGAPAHRADVAVAGGRIVGVGDLHDIRARRVLDVDGLTVTPGFIDMHAHSDYTLWTAPEAESRVGQGITTEVVGNCGYSPAPVQPERRALVRTWTGSLGADLDFTWTRLREFLQRLEATRVATNVVPLVGHGAIRVAVMGFERRAPVPDELATMRQLVAEAMEDGAYGLSTGLIYPPATYAETEEIVALAEVAGRYGGVYFTHMRDEADGLLAAIREALRIGRDARIPVQISHLKAAGRRQWGRLGEAVALIQEARAAGQDVAADFYPYDAGATFLYGLLPPFLMEGGVPALVDRSARPEVRRHVARAIAEGLPGWWNPLGAIGSWSAVRLIDVRSERNRGLLGRTLTDIARSRGRTPLDTAMDLLVEERGAVQVVIHMMHPDDIETAARTPFVMMGTDGEARCLRQADQFLTHPRAYGTTARWLSTYVRERGTSTWEEAVWRMTGMPARRLGLNDRGTVRKGMAADLAVWDPAAVEDVATYTAPHRLPVGFYHVAVNGELVLENGKPTGRRAGRVLRRGEPMVD
jgi:N-acyl-D-amino-acid deacylase